MNQDQIPGEHLSNLLERLFRHHFPYRGTANFDFDLLGPQGRELSILLPKGSEYSLPVNPIRAHMFSEIINKAQEGINSFCARWDRPIF